MAGKSRLLRRRATLKRKPGWRSPISIARLPLWNAMGRFVDQEGQNLDLRLSFFSTCGPVLIGAGLTIRKVRTERLSALINVLFLGSRSVLQSQSPAV